MRKALYIWGELDDSDIEWLAENGSREHIPAGTSLIREGQPVDSLAVVLDGRLVVTAGDGTEVASLFAGEIVGEISFVDSRPPSASVTAGQDSQILLVPRDILRAHLSKDTAFAARFYRALAVFLADRLRVTTARFGYGSSAETEDAADELAEDQIESVDMAALRFDKMLKRLLAS